MSCGKNFAVWKTAGREIPWHTPDAPNNIIHVRLATGSVVEQMNAHPFAKLHTALTHNGETTNYEALKQRVEQFRGWDKISSSFYFSNLLALCDKNSSNVQVI
jgi:predicted glutamine amidotransferase